MEAIKTSVTNSPAESEVKGKAVKKSGKRIGYNYIILKSLKESQKNDVVKCLYIKSLTNFGICVIKEGTYGDSKDKQGRDIKDRLMWQRELHEKLQDKVRLPRLLGSFEENGNYYLVLERIKGKSLYKACKDAGKDLREGLITGNKLGMKFLGYMIQMIELLETLHKHGIVHRDVTATNFMITPRGKVAVIDMELSYSLDKEFPSPPFQLGTWGYMSPEQERTEAPNSQQDVFSVGVVLFQIWTGIWPTKLTEDPFDNMAERVRFFVPDCSFAEIIIKCLSHSPKSRPQLAEVIEYIKRYKNDLNKKIKRPKTEPEKFGRSEIIDTVQRSVFAISSPLLADLEMGWFSEDQSLTLSRDKKKIHKIWNAGFYRGASGVIYMLSKAKKVGIDIEIARPFIEKGLKLIELRYVNRIEDANPSYHFGSAGIAYTLSNAINEGLIEPREELFRWIEVLLKRKNTVLGFQSGIAGQGMAHLNCHSLFGSETLRKKLIEIANDILEKQQPDGSWHRAEVQHKNRITRGFAHGVAGIIYFLLIYAEEQNSKESFVSARRGLNWLISKAQNSNELVAWRSSKNTKVAPWWCEGVAGIALTFLKAYESLGDTIYKEYAIRALNNHDKNVVHNNLSQCHGLSGLGEVYLEAYRVLKQDEWIFRADWIAQVLMNLKKEHQYGPYWLVENERQPVADFMIGCSGICHYLLRFCSPEKIGFPMLR